MCALTVHICSFALCSRQLHLCEWQSTDHCTIITHTLLGDAGQAAFACSVCLLKRMRAPSEPAVPVNCAKRGLAETLRPNKPQLAVLLRWSDKTRPTDPHKCCNSCLYNQEHSMWAFARNILTMQPDSSSTAQTRT